MAPAEGDSEDTAPLAGGRLRLGQAAFASVYADGILAVLSIALFYTGRLIETR